MASKLIAADNILLFPHIGIDGDCAGCTYAVASMLRSMGKNVYALYEEELPDTLNFLDAGGIFTKNAGVIADDSLDISMCIDNGGFDRFPNYAEKFKKAKLTLCLDHHETSIIRDNGETRGIAELSHIDPGAAACGVLTFELLRELEAQWTAAGNPSILPDKAIGEAIFTAITTDTGNFQYSNTNRRCHEIMAELYDWDIDVSKISVTLYENERIEAIEVRSKAVSRMKILSDGLGVISYLKKSELDDLGILPGETDSIIDLMRTMRGVEFAAFLKEKEAGVIRVSLRAKSTGNVAEIAEKFGGGGHIKAAGCTINATVEEAADMIAAEIEKAAYGLTAKNPKKGMKHDAG